MDKTITEKAHKLLPDTDGKHLLQAELLKQILEYCSIAPGADITITVTHAHGQKVTADLYDHAALVQGLIEALEYFQSEII
jgi:hypothetical protein